MGHRKRSSRSPRRHSSRPSSHHHHHHSSHSKRTTHSKAREPSVSSTSASFSHSVSRSPSPELPDRKKARRSSRSRSPTPDSDGPSREVLQRTSGNQKRFTTTYLDGGEERVLVELPIDEMETVVGEKQFTIKKISRMTNTTINYDRARSTLELKGAEGDVKRANKYIFFRRAEKRNEVRLQERDDDGDITVLDIPQECAGFVSGTKGFNMREIEFESETFIYYGIDERRPKISPDMITVIIFGERLGRRRAELRVMSLVEIKLPKYYTDNSKYRPRLESPEVDWGTDIIDITQNYKMLLGKGGATKRKLARAANCAIEYIGTYAFISGNNEQRRRGRTYIQALIDQITIKRVDIPDIDQRDDITVIQIPTSSVGYVTGKNGAALREIEEKTNTFCFMEGTRSSKMCRVFACGAFTADREEAIQMVENLNRIKLEIDERFNKKRMLEKKAHTHHNHHHSSSHNHRSTGLKKHKHRSRSVSVSMSKSSRSRSRSESSRSKSVSVSDSESNRSISMSDNENSSTSRSRSRDRSHHKKAGHKRGHSDKKVKKHHHHHKHSHHHKKDDATHATDEVKKKVQSELTEDEDIKLGKKETKSTDKKTKKEEEWRSGETKKDAGKKERKRSKHKEKSSEKKEKHRRDQRSKKKRESKHSSQHHHHNRHKKHNHPSSKRKRRTSRSASSSYSGSASSYSSSGSPSCSSGSFSSTCSSSRTGSSTGSYTGSSSSSMSASRSTSSRSSSYSS